MLRRFSTTVLALAVVACIPAGSRAADVSTRALEGADGALPPLVRFAEEPGVPGPGPLTAAAGGSREATVFWHRYLEDAIYTSTGLSGSQGLAFAGTYLNDPMHAELTPLGGDGTPDWTHGGNRFYVDASRDGRVLAAVNFIDAESRAVIMEWEPGSPLPIWTFEVSPCRPLTYAGWASRKPIQVSDDGSTIAVAMVRTPGGSDLGHLYVFEAGTGTPVVDWDFPEGNVVAMDITAGGDYVAMAGWPTVYVYDCAAGALRWSGPIYSGNDALCISDDGQYIAWGWTTLRVYQWNGSSYGSYWTHSPGSGYYLGQCAFSPDGSRLALTFDNGSSQPSELWVELREMPSLDLLWDYDYLAVPGGPQRDSTDVASQMFFSPDGSHFAVASWGDTFPELHVFERSSPAPVFTLDTPGSMFDVSIAPGGDGTTCVVACGKHVHAGVSGRGGDLYAIGIGGGSTVSADLACVPSAGTVPFTSAMTVTMANLYPDLARRIAGRIDVALAGGGTFPGWRAGYTNVSAGGSYVSSWNQNIPAIGTVIGENGFLLVAEDVTPAPYNQPPYPPAGDTASASCIVTGITP
jgi:hypothetical protein